MLLECLDAQGTFLQQSTFYSIEFPYEANGERGEGVGAQREREDVRKYRSGETLLNSLLQEWNLHFALFIHLFSCFCCMIFHFSMQFLSNDQ